MNMIENIASLIQIRFNWDWERGDECLFEN